jgi:predicted MPP superfamily phosphohydrolase
MMLKYIRLVSDLHLDLDARLWANQHRHHDDKLNGVAEIDRLYYPATISTDMQTALLIPGDLWTDNNAFKRRFGGPTSWIERVSKQFHSVILLLGNHDYWDGALNSAERKARASITEHGLENVHLLEDSSVVIENVKFLGGTLWTDYKRGDPLVQLSAPNYMKPDFEYIKVAEPTFHRKLWTSDIAAVHAHTRKYIFKNARRDNPEQKVVVLSHHAPSFLSVDEKYHTAADYTTNFFYFSDLDSHFYEDDVVIDLWVHGHMHSAKDYTINKTRVICNPRGYAGTADAENSGFDETLRLEINRLQEILPAADEVPSLIPILDEDDNDESSLDIG